MNISSLNKSIGKTLNKWTYSKTFQKQFNKCVTAPEAYAAAIVVTSIVSKDVINCVLYTSQSWNNKKIPEDKRKFVAMTDLTNGIIMVGGQLLAKMIIEKKTGPNLYGKLFSGEKLKFKNGVKTIESRLGSKAPLAPDNAYKSGMDAVEKHKQQIMEKIKEFEKNPEVRKDICEELAKKHGKDGKVGKAINTGFGIIVVMLGTTALVKRTIAPLLSTPWASWVKKKYIDPKDAAAAAAKAAEAKKAEAKPEDKKAQTPEELDAKLLDHSTAPWNYTSKDGDKVEIKNVAVK